MKYGYLCKKTTAWHPPPPHFQDLHILTCSLEQAKMDLIHCFQLHWWTSCVLVLGEYTVVQDYMSLCNMIFGQHRRPLLCTQVHNTCHQTLASHHSHYPCRYTPAGTKNWASNQTWNLSQAPQACQCKILLVWVKCLAKHKLFLLQFGLVCVQIMGVELTRVSLHYKYRVATTLHAPLGLFRQENTYWSLIYPHKMKPIEFYHNLRCFVAILRSLWFTHFWVKFGLQKLCMCKLFDKFHVCSQLGQATIGTVWTPLPTELSVSARLSELSSSPARILQNWPILLPIVNKIPKTLVLGV